MLYLQQHETRNCTNIRTLFLVYAPFHVYTQSCTLIVFVFRVLKLAVRCYSTGALHITGSVNMYNGRSFSWEKMLCKINTKTTGWGRWQTQRFSLV